MRVDLRDREQLARLLDAFFAYVEPQIDSFEKAVRTITKWSDKQHFLNTVYERFFQGYSVKLALFRQDLIALLDLLQEHKVQPLIAQRIPLAEARRAQELLEKGGVIGKIVLVRGGA